MMSQKAIERIMSGKSIASLVFILLQYDGSGKREDL
uniref:Uncharacterized protein n=1 Tax=Anguilla anguilla TaxID=7936 RepID=A0A0E9PLH0_ANGAN